MSRLTRTRFFGSGLLVLLTAVLVLGGSRARAAPQDGAGLFEESPLVPVERASPDPAVTRSAFVNVRLNLLEQVPPDGRLEMDLFHDVSLVAVIDHQAERSTRSFSRVGHVEGIDESYVAFMVNDGVVAGSITLPFAAYQVRYAGEGVHSIREVDRSAYPPELDPVPVRAPEAAPPDTGQLDDGSRFDLLVAYTPAARAAAGGTAAMEALILLGETETNQAYANSNIIPRLNVVHMAEVSYTESGNMGTDLGRLRSQTDGFMDVVHDLRDTHAADLVKLITNTGGGCGVAYLMCGVSSGFESSAFSVTRRSCVSPNYTYAHELGHNQGCNHAPVDPTGCGAFSYSFGYKNPDNLFRTVMAYNCSGGCPRVLQFSNPDVDYLGVTTGTAGQNNAQSIDNVRTTVANFRQATATTPTVLLKINGAHPVSDLVLTSGPLQLTLSVEPGAETDALDWYYAFVYEGVTYWVTAGGVTTTPAPLLTAPPVSLVDTVLLDWTYEPGTLITFVFLLADGATVVDSDFITAYVVSAGEPLPGPGLPGGER